MWTGKHTVVQNPRLPVGGGLSLVAVELRSDSHECECELKLGPVLVQEVTCTCDIVSFHNTHVLWKGAGEHCRTQKMLDNLLHTIAPK